MADVKISALPADSAPTLTDSVVTYDIETNTTKRTLLSTLLALFTTNISPVWSSWTPVITAQTGTIGTTSATGKYVQIGKTVFFSAALTITTVGTGGGACTFTLPVTASSTGWAGQFSFGSGREGSLNGKSLTVIYSTPTKGDVRNYDNSTPIGAGAVLYVSGTYEAV